MYNWAEIISLFNPIPSITLCSRMEQNHITEIPAKAFANYRRLRRIDLSNNNISRIAHDAFAGLKSLNSLVLYGNKIKDLPAGVFKGLTSLQLLLLNANEISCIRKDSFRDLSSLSLLSLYDNNIQTLPNGTFESLRQIQTMWVSCALFHFCGEFLPSCGRRWKWNSIYPPKQCCECSARHDGASACRK